MFEKSTINANNEMTLFVEWVASLQNHRSGGKAFCGEIEGLKFPSGARAGFSSQIIKIRDAFYRFLSPTFGVVFA